MAGPVEAALAPLRTTLAAMAEPSDVTHVFLEGVAGLQGADVEDYVRACCIMLEDPDPYVALVDAAMDLTAAACSRVATQPSPCWLALLQMLSRVGHAREVYMGLVEGLEATLHSDSPHHAWLLLPALAAVLGRLQGRTLARFLRTAVGLAKDIPDWEETEEMQGETLPQQVDLLGAFVEGVGAAARGMAGQEGAGECWLVAADYLLWLLDTAVGPVPTTHRTAVALAPLAMAQLGGLGVGPDVLLRYARWKEAPGHVPCHPLLAQDRGDGLSVCGVAVGLHWALGTPTVGMGWPQVLAPSHRAWLGLPYARALLLGSGVGAGQRGFAVARQLLVGLEAGTVEGNGQVGLEWAALMLGVLTYGAGCGDETVRQEAYPLLGAMIQLYVPACRLHVLHQLLRDCPHSKAGAAVVQLGLQCMQWAMAMQPWRFDALQPLLHTALAIQNDADLLQRYDVLVAGLNCLRYLLIRDKPGANTTGVWDHMTVLAQQLLQPLAAACERTLGPAGAPPLFVCWGEGQGCRADGCMVQGGHCCSWMTCRQGAGWLGFGAMHVHPLTMLQVTQVLLLQDLLHRLGQLQA